MLIEKNGLMIDALRDECGLTYVGNFFGEDRYIKISSTTVMKVPAHSGFYTRLPDGRYSILTAAQVNEQGLEEFGFERPGLFKRLLRMLYRR